MTNFAPSKYQQAIYDFVATGTGNANVNAVAGSGKTTTIAGPANDKSAASALRFIRQNQRATFLAFNKSIAAELKERVPSNVYAATFHSVGYSAWMRHSNSRPQIDDKKMRKLLDAMCASNTQLRELVLEQGASGPVLKLVALMKAHALAPGAAGHGELVALCENFDIDDPFNDDYGTLCETALNLLQRGIDQAKDKRQPVIDFDDMLYMPWLTNARFFRSDWVFVDEAQDTNPVQRFLLERMLSEYGKGGRLVAVGDPHQAIYGFRGASADAMNLLASKFNSTVLPLSVSYRCAQAVVKEAQRFVPHIEYSEFAPEGNVVNLPSNRIAFDNRDAILCRNTAPLVSLAYQLIAKGQGCTILGRDIGEQLVGQIKRFKARSVSQLDTKIRTWCENERKKLLKRDDEQAADAIQDRADALYAVIAGLGWPEKKLSVDDVVAAVQRMFTADANGLLTLCTVHKSKGLEWDRVFIHRPDLMPSRYANLPWQRQQEVNLQYVAATRARRELVYIGPAEKEETDDK